MSQAEIFAGRGAGVARVELEDVSVALGDDGGFAAGIAPAVAVEVGEDGAAQADEAVSGGVAFDVDVGDDLGGLLDVSDFAEVDGVGEAGGDGVALGVAGEIASADAGHGEEEQGGGGEDGGHHDHGGAGQRSGEPVQGGDGAAALEESGNGQRRGVGGVEGGAAEFGGHEPEDGQDEEERKGGEKGGVDGENGGRQHHEKREHGEVGVVAVALDVEELDADAEQDEVDGGGDEVLPGEEKEVEEEDAEVDHGEPGGDAPGNDEGLLAEKKDSAQQERGRRPSTRLSRSSLPVAARVPKPVTIMRKSETWKRCSISGGAVGANAGRNAGGDKAGWIRRGHGGFKYRGEWEWRHVTGYPVRTVPVEYELWKRRQLRRRSQQDPQLPKTADMGHLRAAGSWRFGFPQGRDEGSAGAW